MKALEATDLPALFEALEQRGYEISGPTLETLPGIGTSPVALGDQAPPEDCAPAGAVAYRRLASAADLPQGWGARQAPGTYRLEARDDAAFFGHGPGAQSWKPHLFRPAEDLLTVHRDAEGELTFRPREPRPRRRAFLGVRPCDLAAIAVQDRVFLEGDHPDPHYRAHRRELFLVVVQCTESQPTCFCASMGTGPRASGGFDLALTELTAKDEAGDGAAGHTLLLEAGSEAGEEILDRLPVRQARPEEVRVAEELTAAAAESQERSLPEDVRRVVLENLEHPRWGETSLRCLACTNCTLVCPTCFCSRMEDSSELSGGTATRRRLWDSCFSFEHSRLHGGPVRASGASRYRQWLSHKLATWHDQFGTPGCVGCGRCITWCPVGIDLTEEVAALGEAAASAETSPPAPEATHPEAVHPEA